MNLVQFQEASKRTFPDLGSDVKNYSHCVAGVVTELGEILDIYKKELAYGKEVDKKHLGEEIGDALFYVVNLGTLTLEGPLPEEQILGVAYDEETIKSFDLAWEEGATNMVCESISRFINSPIDSIPMVISFLFMVAKKEGLVFNDLLQINVNKLLVRYPLEEGFSNVRALNRDLEAESVKLGYENKNELPTDGNITNPGSGTV